jgi:hypothetical protein
VDACLLGGAPGEVHVQEPRLDGPEGITGAGAVSVHQIGPAEALAVASLLDPERVPRRVRLVLVETEGLDDAGLEAACERVVSILDREVERENTERMHGTSTRSENTERENGAGPRSGHT